MGAHASARAAYLVVKDDASTIATLRAELKSLTVESLTSDDFGFDLTSSVINGQSFSGKRTTTKRERLQMLQQLLMMVDHHSAISSKTTPTF